MTQGSGRITALLPAPVRGALLSPQVPMHHPRAILFASVLSLVGGVHAQVGPQTVLRTEDAQSWQVGSALVRVQGTRAQVSRDQGRTWQDLHEVDHRIHLRFGRFDPMLTRPAVAERLDVPQGNTMHIVQFETQILAEYRSAIEHLGAEIVSYLPQNALLVRGDQLLVDAMRAMPCVRWVGGLPLAWKLEEELHAVAGADGSEVADHNVMFALRADREQLAAQVRDLGGKVRIEGGIFHVCSLTPRQLLQVAALDTVQWIDRTTENGTDMDNARIQGGGNHVETVAGLTGQGVRGEISEGLEQGHPDYAGRTVLLHYDGTDSHGHCTSGIVFGAGAAQPQARGMLPSGTMIEAAYSTWTNLITRYQLIQQSTDPAQPWRAMFQTASWGGARTLLYTSVSAESDAAIFDFDLAWTQSQSNAGNQQSRPQAWAKNIISVGGVRHANDANPANDTWAAGASIGPASDGRIKPEVTSYYDSVWTSDLSGTAGYNTAAGVTGNYFTTFSGTSSATPIVAGHLGLLLQMYTNGAFGNPLPLPATDANRFDNNPAFSTAKALLVNTAVQYPFVGAAADLSRVKQGWGFPNVQVAWDNRDRILLTDQYNPLQQGQSRTYLTWLAPGTTEFHAAMVYPDPAASPTAAIHRINSVNLRVDQVGTNNFWWGNNGLLDGNFSTAGGNPNDLDTTEKVILNNPASGVYAIKVEATAVVQDGNVATPQLDVNFSLAARPMGGGYRKGTFDFDLSSTQPGELVATCTNVPATGWTDGYTFFSLSTLQPKGFGNFFGMEEDFLAGSIFALPATAGDVFHFTNAAGQYPFVPYVFSPALIGTLAGLRFDGFAMLFDATGAIVGMSNVDRVTIQ